MHFSIFQERAMIQYGQVMKCLIIVVIFRYITVVLCKPYIKLTVS